MKGSIYVMPMRCQERSVVTKWFNRGEEFERESDQLRKDWIDDKKRLVAPSHLPFEVADSIWKNPNIGVRRAGKLAEVLVAVCPELDNLSEAMAEDSMSIARKRHLLSTTPHTSHWLGSFRYH